MGPSNFKKLPELRGLLFLAGVVVGTLCLACLGRYLHAPVAVAATILFSAVLAVARLGRRVDAVAASLTAALFLDYFFLPPVGTVTVSDPQDWIVLAVFVSASLFAGNLSARLRTQRDELLARQKDDEKLHALNRAILLNSAGDVRREIVNKTLELFGFSETALYEGATGEVRRSETPGSLGDEALRRAAVNGAVERLANPPGEIWPIALGNKAFGSLGYRGVALTDATRQILADTIAVGLAGAQAQEAAAQAEVVKRGEELKSVMIDALAHELKTPLTSIEAATELLLSPSDMSSEEHVSLLQVVREETQGISKLVDEALHLARIDAKRLRLKAELSDARDLLEDAVTASRARQSHAVVIEAAHNLPPVIVDRELIVQALKQILDNARKYTPAGSVIRVEALCRDGLLSIAVQDSGAGLTELEQSRVFEKFYRGASVRSSVAGTGMGLSIAKEIVEAHAGGLSVESSPGRGSRFTLTLHVDAVTADAQGVS